jgi:hypothetical protein
VSSFDPLELPPELRVCERCGAPALGRHYRFCIGCANRVLGELEEVGYLEPLAWIEEYRSKSARENIRETKFGIDS